MSKQGKYLRQKSNAQERSKINSKIKIFHLFQLFQNKMSFIHIISDKMLAFLAFLTSLTWNLCRFVYFSIVDEKKTVSESDVEYL